ncbi:MAG: methyl-accepting chemotaxis protein [Pseudomonadota bacterium]
MTVHQNDLTAQRRMMIDLIATTRDRCVRVALFGAMLHRTNPDRETTEAERTNSASVLMDTVNWIERVAALVTTGVDPWEKIPEPVSTWLLRFSDQMPETVEKITAMAALSRRVADNVDKGSQSLGRALEAHLEARRDGLMDAIALFCDKMWATMDAEREAEVTQAKDAGEAIQQTLSRLEAIGKHVRLVSLNASVEAARVGDAGKGLGVIAVEFKSLAEEIQHLTNDGRARIDALAGER